MEGRRLWEGLVHRTGKSSRGGGRDWFARQEKSREAVEGTGGDGDPSSRCCGCRRAHDPRSPTVDEAALEDSGMPETVASPEGVKFDSVSRRKGPLGLERSGGAAGIEIPSKNFRSVLGLRQHDGNRRTPPPLSRIVDSITEDRGCGGMARDWQANNLEWVAGWTHGLAFFLYFSLLFFLI